MSAVQSSISSEQLEDQLKGLSPRHLQRAMTNLEVVNGVFFCDLDGFLIRWHDFIAHFNRMNLWDVLDPRVAMRIKNCAAGLDKALERVGLTARDLHCAEIIFSGRGTEVIAKVGLGDQTLLLKSCPTRNTAHSEYAVYGRLAPALESTKLAFPRCLASAAGDRDYVILLEYLQAPRYLTGRHLPVDEKLRVFADAFADLVTKQSFHEAARGWPQHEFRPNMEIESLLSSLQDGQTRWISHLSDHQQLFIAASKYIAEHGLIHAAHADAAPANMLFDQTAEKVVLFDFQTFKLAPLGLDLGTFSADVLRLGLARNFDQWFNTIVRSYTKEVGARLIPTATDCY